MTPDFEKASNKRFCISHIILSIFLFAFGIAASWFLISAWIHSDFTPLMLLYIPTFCLVGVLPLYAAVACVIEELKKLRKNDT